MKINVSRLATRRSGFTLMELMLVLGIITLLMAASLKIGPMINKNGKEVASQATIGNIVASLSMYQNKHNGRLPESLEKMVGGEISEDMLMDAWGNKFLYKKNPPFRSKVDKFDVYSIGNDQVADTGDDFGNFDAK
jgi:general secretion pathway protein G